MKTSTCQLGKKRAVGRTKCHNSWRPAARECDGKSKRHTMQEKKTEIIRQIKQSPCAKHQSFQRVELVTVQKKRSFPAPVTLSTTEKTDEIREHKKPHEASEAHHATRPIRDGFGPNHKHAPNEHSWNNIILLFSWMNWCIMGINTCIMFCASAAAHATATRERTMQRTNRSNELRNHAERCNILQLIFLLFLFGNKICFCFCYDMDFLGK